MSVEQLVHGNNAFALALYPMLGEKHTNTVFSPYSLSFALGLAYAGARGDTERGMAQVLRITLPKEQLHRTVQRLSQQLASTLPLDSGGGDLEHRLEIATSLWARLGSSIRPEYAQTLATHYGIVPGLLDFAGDPEGSRTTINDWVTRETAGRIDDLIPSGVISAITRLIIANAVFFKVAWSTPFDPTMTTRATFHLPTGDEVPVPMMFQTAYLGYGEIGELLAVELPYAGEQISMIILLPKDPAMSLVDVSLDIEQADTQLRGLTRQTVALSLPGFGFDSAFRLSQTLSALGMAEAFSTSADFSGIAPGRSIYLSEVLHKAFVSVDETGTEAGAASAVVMSDSGRSFAEAWIKVDRPFLFLIRHIDSGSILFLGHVVDPRR